MINFTCRSSSVFPGAWEGRASSSWFSAVMGTGYISTVWEEDDGLISSAINRGANSLVLSS